MYPQAELFPVPGFPGYYITRQGRVWSEYRFKPKWLQPTPCDRSGHLIVRLSRDKKVHTLLVHRLVLTTFVGPCPEGMECRHLNGNPADNRLENLKWGTKAENSQDALRHGTHPGLHNRGEACGASKLTAVEVRWIRWLYSNNLFNQRELAEIFPVNRSQIGFIIQRKKWQHVAA